jgi:hypothetical protein
MTEKLEQSETTTIHNPIYTFIHIPKCGGTAVENMFLNHYSDRIVGTTHKWVATLDNNPIVIIRNPVDRFISLYNYWKNGSHGRNYRNADFRNKYGDYSIKDFIQLIRQNKTQDMVVGYVWRVHYYPQTFWIPKETHANSIVITYVNNLDYKIQQLLDYCKIENKKIKLPVSNVTIKKPGEEVVLDNEDFEWLQQHFKDDFELWENAFMNPGLFKKVI